MDTKRMEHTIADMLIGLNLVIKNMPQDTDNQIDQREHLKKIERHLSSAYDAIQGYNERIKLGHYESYGKA